MGTSKEELEWQLPGPSAGHSGYEKVTCLGSILSGPLSVNYSERGSGERNPSEDSESKHPSKPHATTPQLTRAPLLRGNAGGCVPCLSEPPLPKGRLTG